MVVLAVHAFKMLFLNVVIQIQDPIDDVGSKLINIAI